MDHSTGEKVLFDKVQLSFLGSCSCQTGAIGPTDHKNKANQEKSKLSPFLGKGGSPCYLVCFLISDIHFFPLHN